MSSIVALLTQDARERSALDPLLWRIAADAPDRIERTAGASLNGHHAPARELWFVAEHAGRIVGVTHAMLVPVPPIYDGTAGPPGLLLDDCFVSADTPSGTAEALLAATEAALTTAGAPRLIASCPAAGRLRPLYERHGYEPVTLYMAKHRLRHEALSPSVRMAGAEDVPGIVKRSTEHRQALSRINPRFWRIHPDADCRFEAWMRRSLTFRDRDMLVATAGGEVRGYVIAQPIAPLLVPAAHEITAIGVVDDFYDEDLQTSRPSRQTRRAARTYWQRQKARLRDAPSTAPSSFALRGGRPKSLSWNRAAIRSPSSGCCGIDIGVCAARA